LFGVCTFVVLIDTAVAVVVSVVVVVVVVIVVVSEQFGLYVAHSKKIFVDTKYKNSCNIIIKHQLYYAQNGYLYCLSKFHWSQTKDNNSVYYRENINFMYVHFCCNIPFLFLKACRLKSLNDCNTFFIKKIKQNEEKYGNNKSVEMWIHDEKN